MRRRRYRRGAYGLMDPGCPEIQWRPVHDAMATFRHVWEREGASVHPKCKWALDVALSKQEESHDYQARGACAEAMESALGAMMYQGILYECQHHQKPKPGPKRPKKKKKSKKRTKRKKKR